jgi:hypothetical protein
MKNIVISAALLAALASGAALAQDTTSNSATPSGSQTPQPQAEPQAAPTTHSSTATPTAARQEQTAVPTRIAPGSVILVQLTTTIDTKKAKPGDPVTAKVTKDLKAANGELLIAKNTKVVGHVTEARAWSKEQKESEVGIAFDHAVTKDGDMKLPMSIQAIIGPAPSSPSFGGGGGYDPPGPATGGGTMTSPMSGRAPLSGPSQPPTPPLPTGGTDAQTRPPITGNTQGVVGMPDLKLEAHAQSGSLGSVVSSEKSNVKLESGTVMLLRVN